MIAYDGSQPFHKNQGVAQVESLFSTEATFWLVNGVATGFTLQTLLGSAADDLAAEAVDRFHATLSQGEVEKETVEKAKKQTLENLEEICKWQRQTCAFDYEVAFTLCESFTAYWMLVKLIEVEWHKTLDTIAITETYQFLDGVLADREELEFIEKRYQAGEKLEDDEIVYLRSHWETGRKFFERMRAELGFLDRGIIPFVTTNGH